MEPTDTQITVGWRERVDLPDWRVRGIRAKIDTGARTSAVHVDHIEEVEDGHLRFAVVVRQRPSVRLRWVTAPLVRESVVKPSSGVRQRRPVVLTTLSLGGVAAEIELSLVCRREMLCRMLVGRTALAGRYLVDASQTYLVSAARKGGGRTA
ncbi:RimK/LysX family protein [Pyruvatibacter sp.]|uniref:ATP-dependent zinc protease family protein n=1 Tax=Pyruvatibacter sp. TaxID=1981328 RepID=UPI0032EB5E3A